MYFRGLFKKNESDPQLRLKLLNYASSRHVDSINGLCYRLVDDVPASSTFIKKMLRSANGASSFLQPLMLQS